MKQKNSKVVLLLSGGIDSTVLAASLAKQFEEVHGLTFNYGQRHQKEIDCARNVAERLCIHHKIVDISSIQSLISQGALTGDEEVPEAHYDHESQKVTIVPNRNAILLALAVGYSIKIESQTVAYAAHWNDSSIYPDCREAFVKAFNNMSKLATDDPQFKVYAPFIHFSKANIIRYGTHVDAPFELTWSCYKGDKLACGKCGTCVERIEAFKLNNLVDPIPYAIPIDWEIPKWVKS